MSPPAHTWTRLWSAGGDGGAHPSARLRNPLEDMSHGGSSDGVIATAPDASARFGSFAVRLPNARRNPRLVCTSWPFTFASIRTRKPVGLLAFHLKGPVVTGVPDPP